MNNGRTHILNTETGECPDEAVAIPGGPPQWFCVQKRHFKAHFGAPKSVLVANFQPVRGVSFSALRDAVRTVYSALNPDLHLEVDPDTKPGPTLIVFLPGVIGTERIAPFVRKALDIIDRALAQA